MYSSFWYKNFDGMAYKTMLRQLISKWGVMSIELQKAFEGDMSTFDESGHATYVENDNEEYVDTTVTDVPEQQEEQMTQSDTGKDQQSADSTQMNAAEAALFG